MSLLTIDELKCKKDGLCVMDCPTAIIRQRDKDSYPVMISRGPQACLLCGHCVAVCPHDALDHVNIPMKDSPAILKNLDISPDQAAQFLRSRRSIRRFKDKPVAKEAIAPLINTARCAPTGSNSQLISWTVHTNAANLKAMSDMTIDWMRESVKSGGTDPMTSYLPMIIAAYDAGINGITHNAPAIVFASTPDASGDRTVDIAIALSYFELAAWANGLGTCWLGLITRAMGSYEPLQELVGLPEGHKQYFYPMVIGYPKFKYHRLPERKPARINWK